MGVVDNYSYITHFEELKAINSGGFKDDVFYVMMVGEGDFPDIAELDCMNYNFYQFTDEDDEDFIVIANNMLKQFVLNATFH